MANLDTAKCRQVILWGIRRINAWNKYKQTSCRSAYGIHFHGLFIISFHWCQIAQNLPNRIASFFKRIHRYVVVLDFFLSLNDVKKLMGATAFARNQQKWRPPICLKHRKQSQITLKLKILEKKLILIILKSGNQDFSSQQHLFWGWSVPLNYKHKFTFMNTPCNTTPCLWIRCIRNKIIHSVFYLFCFSLTKGLRSKR